MATWDMGYHSDLLYTTGYYREISPVYINYVLSSQGYDFPKLDENFNACELGFGQGVSITMHAAGTNVNWYGNDFNPTQVNFARTLAQAAKLNTTKLNITDKSFGDYLAQKDLPEFDFICLHGIWSWISPENQQIIVDFVRDHLKIGGVLYISYNVGPGFTTFEPMRHLMHLRDTNFHSPSTDARLKFQDIATFLRDLLNVNPRYNAVVPGLKERLDSVLEKDYHYLSGEYLNSFWDIRHFDSLAKEFERAKLNYVCSATLSEHIDNINLTQDQQAFLAPYKGTIFGECVRDFIVNQQFRRDIFIKGPLKLNPKEAKKRLDNIYVMLNQPYSEIGYTFSTRLGQAELKKETYTPIYELLKDYKPRSIAQIKSALKDKINEIQLDEAILTLTSQAFIAITRNVDEVKKEERERCLSLNQKILSGSLNANLEFLASPILGGGVYVTALSQKILSLKMQKNNIKNSEIADIIRDSIIKSGQNLRLKGQEITDPQQIHAELLKHIEKFDQNYIPFYKATGVI